MWIFYSKVVILVIAGFGSCVQSAPYNYRPLSYTIPQPLIQAFKPKGLKVSIPHIPGIQLFAFHGNINKPLDVTENGILAKEIHEREENHWIYTNSTIKLEIGDKIYYRILIIKDKLGYRIQNQIYEIKDLYFDSLEIDPEYNCTICEKVVLNLTQSLLDLQQEIDSLRETNDILQDLIEKNPEMSKSLILDGVKVKDDDLVWIVQAIITDKLYLPFKIRNIKKNNNRIEFQVNNLQEKLQILKAAKAYLKYSKFQITY